MQSTRGRILSQLKRTGGSSVDELAGEVGVGRMTVRQHLTRMERDGLVSSKEVRRPAGRPHFVFRLTDQGEETFPKRYDRLAELILEEACLLEGSEIDGLGPGDKKRLLFERMADRVLAQHQSKVEGKNLSQRVVEVARILDDEGGFAEWRPVGGGFEITDYNCVYRRVAGAHDELCSWHVSLLGRLLGSGVECSQFISKGASSCRFIVKDGKITQRSD